MKQVDNYVAMRVVGKGILELMQSVQLRGRNVENARKKDILRYAVKLTRRNPDHGDDPQQLEVLNLTVTMVTEMMTCTCLQ
jgi:hypothetical protein